jgi:hypothetical protein
MHYLIGTKSVKITHVRCVGKRYHLKCHEEVREVHIQCNQYATIDDYIVFHDLLDRYMGLDIKDVEYLRRQDWVRWVMEHRAKKQSCTRYIFHGLQGAEKACYEKRQETSKASIFTKVCTS